MKTKTGANGTDAGTLRGFSVEPARVVLVVDGRPFLFEVWTPEKWGRLPEAERRDECRRMDDGGYIRATAATFGG